MHGLGRRPRFHTAYVKAPDQAPTCQDECARRPVLPGAKAPPHYIAYVSPAAGRVLHGCLEACVEHACGSARASGPALPQSRCTARAATGPGALVGSACTCLPLTAQQARQPPNQAPTGSACACAPQFCSLNTYARDGCAARCAPAGGSSAPLGPPPAASSRTPSPDSASVRPNAAPLRHGTAVGGRPFSERQESGGTASMDRASGGGQFPITRMAYGGVAQSHAASSVLVTKGVLQEAAQQNIK